MPRAVLDTNILISALWSPNKLEAQVVDLALNRRFDVVCSSVVWAEYEDVLHRKKFAKLQDRADLLLGRLRTVARFVQPTACVQASRDPDDNHLLECAQAAQADFLVTGNLDHFPTSWMATKILPARAFLLALGVEPRIELRNVTPPCGRGPNTAGSC